MARGLLRCPGGGFAAPFPCFPVHTRGFRATARCTHDPALPIAVPPPTPRCVAGAAQQRAGFRDAPGPGGVEWEDELHLPGVELVPRVRAVWPRAAGEPAARAGAGA